MHLRIGHRSVARLTSRHPLWIANDYDQTLAARQDPARGASEQMGPEPGGAVRADDHGRRLALGRDFDNRVSHVQPVRDRLGFGIKPEGPGELSALARDDGRVVLLGVPRGS